MLNFLMSLQPRPSGQRVREALRYSDISLDAAARWMEMDPRQLARQLDGEGHLKVTALDKLPLKFHRWYHFISLVDIGLPEVVRRSVRLHIAIAHERKQQIRMALHASKERQPA
jgi:hypothetical protein